jgi:hypothetical protein
MTLEQAQSNSGNPSEPTSQQSDQILKLISEYHPGLIAARVQMSNISKLFSKKEEFSPNQCTEIINRINNMSQPLREFYKSLETMSIHQSSENSLRHTFLIELHHVEKIINKELMPSLTGLREICRRPSAQKVKAQRQEILGHLDSLMQGLNKINILINSSLSQEDVAQKIVSDPPPQDKNEAKNMNESQASNQPPVNIQDSSIHYASESKQDLADKPLDNRDSDSRHIKEDINKAPTNIKQLTIFKETSKLRIAIRDAFSDSELELFCKDLEVNYDDMKGDTKDLRIQSLIDYFRRRNQYERLVRKVLEERPHLGEEKEV